MLHRVATFRAKTIFLANFLIFFSSDPVMKPDIVFFGEGLPEEFHDKMAEDKDECDLLIVIGSSLKVRPVALIPSRLWHSCELLPPTEKKWQALSFRRWLCHQTRLIGSTLLCAPSWAARWQRVCLMGEKVRALFWPSYLPGHLSLPFRFT